MIDPEKRLAVLEKDIAKLKKQIDKINEVMPYYAKVR